MWVPHYGYIARKDKDGIRRLYVDENTAPIVKEIFSSYLKDLSTLDISKLLLEKKAYVATDCRKFGKINAEENELIRAWMPTTVLQVLKNRVYSSISSLATLVNVSEVNNKKNIPIEAVKEWYD